MRPAHLAQPADIERIVEMMGRYEDHYGDTYGWMDECPGDMSLYEYMYRTLSEAMGDPEMLLDRYLEERVEREFRWIDPIQPRLLDQIIDALERYIENLNTGRYRR